MASDLLQERKNYSKTRLDDLRRKIVSIDELSEQPNLSIYVTGSYGRLEAHQNSDLDLFFVSDQDRQVDRTTKILIDAELIRIASEMGFPPFSNDAQYLEIHSLKEMLDKLEGLSRSHGRLSPLISCKRYPSFLEDPLPELRE